MKEDYNDNVLYSVDNVQHDFLTTVSPGLTFLNRTERMGLTVTGRLDHRIYSKDTELNATDQTFQGDFRYVPDPRNTFTAKAGYVQDSSPDRDFETTGLPLTTLKRHRQTYGASWDYVFTETAMVSLSYDYGNDTYEGDSYSDLESHSAGIIFIRDLSYFAKPTKGRLHFGYGRYLQSGLRTENYSSTLGFSRDLSEKWSVMLDAGARYTSSRFKVYQYSPIPPFPLQSDDEKNRDWGGVGALALSYKGERMTGELSLSYDLAPASGRSGTAERTSVTLNINRRFTYELGGGVSAGYYKNRSGEGDFSTSSIDEESFRVSPGLRYEFNNDARLEASYDFSKTWYHVEHRQVERNLISLRFYIQRDLIK
ncbi:MAG: hypothetical protein A4E63_00950 [Syntrophorhabdus sp. PtaU1.Bin050]|nr:MAG: hypothetical protein A4E63_00950 [Syntrophorhabdus sp. PtaU1.Bin050]